MANTTSAKKAPTPQKMPTRTKAALWLLVGPTALWIVIFFLFAMNNWLFSGVNTGLNSGGSFGAESMVASIVNLFLFLAGTVAFISWLPGLIIGIVLLATKK